MLKNSPGPPDVGRTPERTAHERAEIAAYIRRRRETDDRLRREAAQRSRSLLELAEADALAGDECQADSEALDLGLYGEAASDYVHERLLDLAEDRAERVHARYCDLIDAEG
jgi:hypothetical protein